VCGHQRGQRRDSERKRRRREEEFGNGRMGFLEEWNCVVKQKRKRKRRRRKKRRKSMLRMRRDSPLFHPRRRID
jgi:hypothetical protein